MSGIDFIFESSSSGGYVNVMGDSDLVKGPIATQDAGSTNYGIYYLVGGGGLNGVFAADMGIHTATVNEALKAAYDVRFGAGQWAKDSAKIPSPAPLTSFLIPLTSEFVTAGRASAMVYSVGPQLDITGINAKVVPIYTQIYADAMEALAASETKYAGFRITLLSSGIYRGGAPIAAFAEQAASCIIDAVQAAVSAEPDALSGLSILINTDRTGSYSKEFDGFCAAAKARGYEVSETGFTVPLA